MNHHKFLMISMLKYIKFWCLVIHKPFYREIVYCNTTCTYNSYGPRVKCIYLVNFEKSTNFVLHVQKNLKLFIFNLNTLSYGTFFYFFNWNRISSDRSKLDLSDGTNRFQNSELSKISIPIFDSINLKLQ